MTERLAPATRPPTSPSRTPTATPVSLADYRGRKVVVYFYPAAMTPGCTKEACDFRDNLAELDGAGIDVLGISPDQPAKLAKFRDAEAADLPAAVRPGPLGPDAWARTGRRRCTARRPTGVIRSTFVVGADGTIEQALYNVKATGHVAALRKKLSV